MDAKERDVASRLGIDPDDPTVQRGLDLFNADADLLDALVQLRRAKGLTQEEVGQRMDRDRTSVTRFERLDSDPRLSTVRRYALAVGATIAHEVQDVDAPPASPPPVPQPAEPPTKVVTRTVGKWLDASNVRFDRMFNYTTNAATFRPVLSEELTLSAESTLPVLLAYQVVKGAAPWGALGSRLVPFDARPPKDQLELWVEL